MRISDWSSDVCSSDLYTMRMIGALRARPRRMVSDTIRRALICLVVVGGCSSESSAPATTTTSSGDATEDITAEVERDRQFGTEGKLGLGFVNHTAAAQTLHDRTGDVEGKGVSVRGEIGGRRLIKT